MFISSLCRSSDEKGSCRSLWSAYGRTHDRLFLVNHGDRLLSICSKMPRVLHSWRSYSYTAIIVTCFDLPMAIFSMRYWYYWKISQKSSSDHEFILVAIDYFTKWVEVASYLRLTFARVASFIRSHIIYRYGVPHELISNRGVHFRVEVNTLLQKYGIWHHRSSAYRP